MGVITLEYKSTSSENDVVTGINAVEGLLQTRPNQIERVYFAKEMRSERLFVLIKECKRMKIHYQIVPVHRIELETRSTRHQGIAAFCSLKQFVSLEVLQEAVAKSTIPALFIVAASVEDPGNLGALIRSAVAFGVHGLILERKNTVSLNATVARASAGMLEHLPIAKPTNLESTLESLIAAGYQVVGAQSEAQKFPTQLTFTGPTVLIVGGEHRGIPIYLQKKCSDFARIPTSPTVPSLNLSAAASVLLYEIARQREFNFV
jgi:23S rRNA (guanosine2251-2'-O)-methyltransferase